MPEERNIDWRIVVDQIRRGEAAGEETLYRELSGGARLFLQRRLGVADVEDQVHDVFLIVVEAIRRDALREPERLMGFVRTILLRQLNLAISGRIAARANESVTDTASRLSSSSLDPEQHAIEAERLEAMLRGMRRMKATDVEILKRFYVRGQAPEMICREMSLSHSQFSVRKSRAKALLTKLVSRGNTGASQ
jgi:DNA-directed RNA polymerase specialized sigma24 family protein